MDDLITICLTIVTLILLGVHSPPTPDLKPYVQAHQAYQHGR